MTYIINDRINPKPLKALYHLGAYDSQDGKTRQSWQVDLSKLSWYNNGTNGIYISNYATDLPMVLNTTRPSTQVICSTYTYAKGETVYATAGTYYINDRYGDAGQRICVNTGSASIKPTGILQYILQSSYTDNGIIENQSILPLDTNMANKIRQKVVDGLNLISAIYQGNGTPDPSMTIRVTAEAELKANQTYHLSLSSSATNTAVYIYYNGTLVRMGDTNELDFSFTTSYTGNHHIIFMAGGGSGTILVSNISNLMLVEGNHAYPHSDFNQREHITNAQAELLKSEEEKSANLFNVDEMITPYVIDASDGSFNYDATTAYIPYASPRYIEVDGNSITWTFPSNYNVTNYPTAFYRVGCYNSSKTFISRLSGRVESQTITLNLPSGTKYIRLGANIPNKTTYKLMLAEGSQAQPYHDWCGEILHEVDRPKLYRHTVVITSTSNSNAAKLKLSFVHLNNSSELINSFDKLKTCISTLPLLLSRYKVLNLSGSFYYGGVLYPATDIVLDANTGKYSMDYLTTSGTLGGLEITNYSDVEVADVVDRIS